MKIFDYAIMAGIFMAMGSANSNAITYPETAKKVVTDTYFGTQVADPYRWLENDTSATTAAWVKAENAVTAKYLSNISFRDALRDRFRKVTSYPTEGLPVRKKGKYYYFRNDGKQNQSVLFEKDSITGSVRTILNPNTFSSEGTVALTGYDISKDGKYLAYTIARNGSDWNEIYVMELATLKLLSDHVMWAKFTGIGWLGDGFFYSCYDAPAKGDELKGANEYHKVKYHKIGTDAKNDELIYVDNEHPLRYNSVGVTEDGHFLCLFVSEGTQGCLMSVKDLKKPNSKFIPLVTSFADNYAVVDNDDNSFLVYTDCKAPNGRLVRISLSNPAPEAWTSIIPENKDKVMTGYSISNGNILVQYNQNVHSVLELYTIDGKFIKEIKLPGIGQVNSLMTYKKNKEIMYGFTSYTLPTTLYNYDVDTDKSIVYHASECDFKSDDFESKQIFYKSKDGTSIPMTIIYKKGIKLDGSNPTLLYGYGGFSISLSPRFYDSNIPFLEAGGVYVLANLRGGAEFGEKWHIAGTKMQKQNVFDDFIAAAEYLIKEKYTSPKRLAINGGSNGGLLVGATMLQRPDLFAVAVPEVGVLDMLRYHKFTIGWGWAGDYGTSDDSKEMFDYLYKYSPVHNVKSGVKYPATLVMTGDHDDRVVPAHSFKFAASLQAVNKSKTPTLIRIETNAGHGAGRPRSKTIESLTDKFSFIMYNLGVKNLSK